MGYSRRQILSCGIAFISISTAGCTEKSDGGDIPLSIDNKSTRTHTIAIIVTDQTGNTEYFVTTTEVEANSEKTLENKIPLPDSVPKEVYVRLLLDTGKTAEFQSTLDIDNRISIEISESGEVYKN